MAQISPDPRIYVPVEHLGSLEVKDRVQRCFEDPVLFCRYYLEHMFPLPMPAVHRGLLAILTRQTQFLEVYGEVDWICDNFVMERDGKTYRIFERGEDYVLRMYLGTHTLVLMPRGFSKTTLCGIADSLYDICYQLVQLSAYVSHAAPHAETQLENVKRELEANTRILHDFGILKPERSTGKHWSVDIFETTNSCAMVARGAGAQIRGLNLQGIRPQKVKVDDVEDRESVSTEEQRKKMRVWGYGDLLPCLPALDPLAAMVVIGTVLHPASLLMTWANDPKFSVIRFGALDRAGKPIWPENMSVERLEAEKRSFTRAGELSTFYLEYHNQVRAEETQIFQQRFFRYGPPTPEDGSLIWAAYCDPAISEAKRADSSVVYAVGMSMKTGRIFVPAPWAQRGAKPRDIIDAFFNYSKRYGASHHGIEANQYQAALIHLVRAEMFKKKHYFDVLPIIHGSKTSKYTRIKGVLQPRYSNGYIQHYVPIPDLESQLLDFPSGVHDDHPDGLAGAIALLDPVAGAGAGADDEIQEDPVDTDEFNEGWRVAP